MHERYTKSQLNTEETPTAAVSRLIWRFCINTSYGRKQTAHVTCDAPLNKTVGPHHPRSIYILLLYPSVTQKSRKCGILLFCTLHYSSGIRASVWELQVLRWSTSFCICFVKHNNGDFQLNHFGG